MALSVLTKTIKAVAVFCVGLAMQNATVQSAERAATSANQSSDVIQTTVIFRTKESDCPSGFMVFRGGVREKFPTAPKICYVKPPHPGNK